MFWNQKKSLHLTSILADIVLKSKEIIAFDFNSCRYCSEIKRNHCIWLQFLQILFGNQNKTLYLTSILADIVLKSKQNIVFDFNSCRYCSEIKTKHCIWLQFLQILFWNQNKTLHLTSNLADIVLKSKQNIAFDFNSFINCSEIKTKHCIWLQFLQTLFWNQNKSLHLTSILADIVLKSNKTLHLTSILADIVLKSKQNITFDFKSCRHCSEIKTKHYIWLQFLQILFWNQNKTLHLTSILSLIVLKSKQNIVFDFNSCRHCSEIKTKHCIWLQILQILFCNQNKTLHLTSILSLIVLKSKQNIVFDFNSCRYCSEIKTKHCIWLQFLQTLFWNQNKTLYLTSILADIVLKSKQNIAFDFNSFINCSEIKTKHYIWLQILQTLFWNQNKTLYLTSILADIVLKSKQNIAFDFNSCRYCSEIKTNHCIWLQFLQILFWNQNKTLYLASILADIVLKSKQNIAFNFNSCRYCSEIK